MSDYYKCCKEYIEKNYKKRTMVSTDTCPICKKSLKPWWYLNEK